MKILYYSPHPTLRTDRPAGYATHIREMIHALRTLGHEVLPVIMGQPEAPHEVLPSQAAPANQAQSSRLKPLLPNVLWQTGRDAEVLWKDRAARRLLAGAIKRSRPDIIYERSAYLQRSGVDAAKRFGIPHVLEVNAPFVDERRALSGAPSLLERYGAALERYQLAQTDGIAVVSTVLGDHLASTYGIPRNKFTVTPNAINVDDFSPGAAAVDHIRRRCDLGAGPVVGFVGSFFRWHGIDLLIRAFASVGDEHPEAKLLIVGDGEIRSELESLISDLGLAGRVTLTGSVPHEEVPAYIACMDITVLARSHWYGSPVKIFEYGALGKAVVAVDNGPVRDVMRDGESGLLVQPDVAAVTTALRRLLGNSELRSRLGRAFREKVLASHTWIHNAETVLDIIRERADGGRLDLSNARDIPRNAQ